MRRTVLGILLLFLAAPAMLLLGQASVSGRITGVVTDAQGAVVISAPNQPVGRPALATQSAR